MLCTIQRLKESNINMQYFDRLGGKNCDYDNFSPKSRSLVGSSIFNAKSESTVARATIIRVMDTALVTGELTIAKKAVGAPLVALWRMESQSMIFWVKAWGPCPRHANGLPL